MAEPNNVCCPAGVQFFQLGNTPATLRPRFCFTSPRRTDLLLIEWKYTERYGAIRSSRT